MSVETLALALITDTFYEADALERLQRQLAEARGKGAELALLPELPLNPWVAVSKNARAEDAEVPGGPRHQMLSAAAKAVGIGVVGGAIVTDPTTGRRHNTALVYDRKGALVATYQKLHLPEEEGFWETSHYEPGNNLPTVIRGFGMPIGIQICSDANRPEGSHILGACGAEVILVPRATPPESCSRWLTVMRANAVTSTTYVLSVNRPTSRAEPHIGGASFAIAPSSKVLVETTDPVVVVELEHARIERARREYPGYLPVRAELYAEGWRQVIK